MVQTKGLKLLISAEISIHTISNQIFLVSPTFLNRRYLHVPNFIAVSKIENKLFFKTSKGKVSFIKFINSVCNWLRMSEKPFKKKIFLKGLGYKADLLEDKKVLNLKIGLSHLINVSIPSNKVSLKINKKMITIKGCSATEVGNFAEKIRRLRVPDSYKGKGIWYKNENRILKVLKKK